MTVTNANRLSSATRRIGDAIGLLEWEAEGERSTMGETTDGKREALAALREAQEHIRGVVLP